MPYLPTSQAFLEQSAELLQAYPSTRIVTKYNFPSTRPSNVKRIQKSQAKKSDAKNDTSAPIATLTLKTFNAATGICLQYRTNKAQEVSRLITTLGKLAAGSDAAGLRLGLSVPAPAPVDVEMTDPPAVASEEPKQQQQAQGGKGKKKGGKGKR